MNCGVFETQACQTLNWLLGQYYTVPHSENETLNITTDISLLINSELIVSILTFLTSILNSNSF